MEALKIFKRELSRRLTFSMNFFFFFFGGTLIAVKFPSREEEEDAKENGGNGRSFLCEEE